MAYNALNNLIDAYIYANGVQAITGQILNGVLKQMVSQLGSGYHLMGVATPQTVPATDDYAMAYFAATAGEYTDFGGITLATGEVAVLITSGNGSWSKQTIYNVPTGTADLENTAGFITNAVTDLVNYYTKTEVDSIVATLSRQEYIVAWDGLAAPDVTAIPAGVTVTYSGTTYTGTLAASASTVNKIYMVWNGTAYDMYGTSRDGGYSWVPMGTTTVDLSQYATKAEVSQLEAKVDDISTGKYYGYYATSADLPDDATVDGFAYVGSGPTYTIYNLRNGVWTSSGIAVNQSPIGNDEDIDQNEDGKLQFANRVYNVQQPNGMGYKVLRKDASLSSQVTDTNTIYEIRYDFDLNSGTISLPSGSVFKFNGGTIKNVTITGNNTVIDAGNVKVFDNVTFAGTFVGSLNAVWVGAVSQDSSVDNSPILQEWFNNYYSAFKIISFPEGTYYFKNTVTLSVDRRNLTIQGNNSIFNVNIPDSNGEGVFFIQLTNNTSGSVGEQFRIQNVRIYNIRKTGNYNISKTCGVLLDRAQRFQFTNVQFWYFDIAVKLVDIWYGAFDNNTFFRGNRVGIMATPNSSYETNTIDLQNVDFGGVSAAATQALYPQNEGESDADYAMRIACVGFDAYTLLQGVNIRGCVFEGFDYAIRTNGYLRSNVASVTGGVFNIDGCFFEGNRTYDIYTGLGNYKSIGSGSNNMNYVHLITISNCRFFTLKKVYLLGALCTWQNNEYVDVTVTNSSQSESVLNYDGNIGLTLLGGASFAYKSTTVNQEKIYQSNGNQSIPVVNFQKLQLYRPIGKLTSRLNDYTLDSSSSNPNPYTIAAWNFNTEPSVKYLLDRQPNTFYVDNRNNYRRLSVISGGQTLNVNADQTLNFNNTNTYGSIPMFEFLRRWKAGISYTGTVEGLFNGYSVIANPTEGSVRRETDNTLVGFGNNGIGTIITNTSPVAYYVYVDAMVYVRSSYSRLKYSNDLIQNGRAYNELRRSVDEANDKTAYLGIYGSNANMANIQKRLNAVYYDTTNSKLMIYNGFEWVEMTSPYQRYYYNGVGAKLSERASIPDIEGQTFINRATGIIYTFSFLGEIGTNPTWHTSIGKVLSLEHPNGYDADNNPMDYTTELASGEMVRYNGNIIRWNGSSFENLDGSAVTP